MTNKTKKYIIVVFLALLIWVSAYLALEKTELRTIKLDIVQSNPSLFVSFVEREKPVRINVTFKGSAAKISKFETWLDTPEPGLQDKSTFYFDADKENKARERVYTVDVLEFLKGSDKIKSFGLTVEKSQPLTVKIEVKELVKQPVSVECFDEKGGLLTHRSIEPPTVEMYVPVNWTTEDMLKARVLLTSTEIINARKESVQARPFIVLGGDNKYAKEQVKIRLSLTDLAQRPGQPKTIEFQISEKMLKQYRPELQNENDLTETTTFRATEEAWQAYLTITPKLIIEVREEDIREDDDPEKVITRPVKHNFPEEYLRKNEIELVGDPREAKFKLVPVTPSSGGS